MAEAMSTNSTNTNRFFKKRLNKSDVLTSDILFLYCVGKERIKCNIGNLASFDLVCREAHVSYADNLSERGIVMMLDSDAIAKLEMDEALCPILIKIENSCLFQFARFDDDERISETFLIVDFEVMPSAPLNLVECDFQLASQNFDPSDIVPLVHLSSNLVCDCATKGTHLLTFIISDDGGEQQNISVNTQDDVDEIAVPIASLDIVGNESDEDRDQEQLDVGDDEENLRENEGQQAQQNTQASDIPVLNTQYFRVVGSVWEERYQNTLKQAWHRKKVLQQEVEIRAVFEPDNIMDKNAIRFECKLGVEWHIMGYCGVQRIRSLQ